MTEDEDATPTAERLAHGAIEHHVEVVAYDREERPVRALVDRALGLIERMARRGTIDDRMADAAERFRTDFRTAQLEPLRASVMRERTQSRFLYAEIGQRAERARARVSEACERVGEPGGSCLRHVIGEEMSLKSWSGTYGIMAESAQGVLISALGTLKAHYRL